MIDQKHHDSGFIHLISNKNIEMSRAYPLMSDRDPESGCKYSKASPPASVQATNAWVTNNHPNNSKDQPSGAGHFQFNKFSVFPHLPDLFSNHASFLAQIKFKFAITNLDLKTDYSCLKPWIMPPGTFRIVNPVLFAGKSLATFA